MSGADRRVSPDDPEYYDDPAWVCERCCEEYPVETGADVTLCLDGGDCHRWALCIDCAYSFTAWRLSRDTPIAGQLGDDERPF